ncbi:RecQ family ATP-dependent DNA helicase [Maribacter hydrothermalis]|uniref:ATP-dependent DNA helicase RecQ n=1 Tax=Maribacter hydrothermalis TaxID=1836467 RepID=A0A1B7Z900_9FLAO|nr:ATP-dependent DNA helicase RecQ [Maribacter hydrothermalis]APQ18820.1 recombinase RecQ [Maribacter hydrothermalis]OBR39166.1 recombinase RecQ [Maribacter hydrothermalis]
MNNTPKDILSKYWGFDNFRGSQEEIINAIVNGQDVLGLLPTGGGKSLCFQVPALMNEGICIVISPLIALIENQVDNLQKLGIKAIGLKGGLKFNEVDKLLDNCIYGGYKFLYLSPERLQQELVQERIKAMNVSLFVIDEAHCISQWGHDFRPAYLNCSILRALHAHPPIIALTATATKRVSDDIIESLDLEHPYVVKDSFFRKNIGFQVVLTEDKNNHLKQYCQHIKQSVIVYVRSRRKAEEISKYLIKNGITSAFYHGGIDQKAKTERLNLWLQDKVKVMVATNAFGMGIDKPDVELVIHYQIPDSLENYFQEAGRAGRNGTLARAILLTNTTDKLLVKKQFIEVLPDVNFIKFIYRKLNNFFQIGYGEFTEAVFSLNFNEFCSTYKLNSYLTYNALLALDRNSVVSLSENFSKKTTIKFKTDKSTLYRYIEQNPKLEEFIKVVLRTYGGVFEFDIKINTYVLAKKLNLPEKVVNLNLEQLAKDDIVDYQSTTSDLELIFLVPRDDDRTINQFSKNIDEQNQLKIENVSKMLNYIDNIKQCRSIQLLDYFGEKQKNKCGICDICMSEKLGNTDVVHAKIKIIQLLKTRKANSRALQISLNINQDVVLLAIQELLEDNYIQLNAINEYELI